MGTHQLELGIFGGALLIHTHTVRHALAFLFRWLCGQFTLLDLNESLGDFGVCRNDTTGRRFRTAFAHQDDDDATIRFDVQTAQ